MRARSHYPEWVEAYRKPGYEIKRIKDRYYLYKYRTVYDSETKGPKKVSGDYLGRITENGLVGKKEKAISPSPAELGAPLEFGASRLLDLLGADILKTLKTYFRSPMAETIFVLGKIGLVDPSPNKRLKLVYDNSFDSIEYPDLAVSGSSMTSFLHELGENREGQLAFMKEYTEGSEYIIFDGTRLVSFSEKMEINRTGFNHCKIEDPQVNLLYCFSLRPNRMPVYFRANSGDKTDITAIKNAIRESGCSDVILIADKGFGSADNYELMRDNGISYIIPLKRNDAIIDYSEIASQGEQAYDGFFLYNDRTIFYKVMQEYSHEIRKIPQGHPGRPRKGEKACEEICSDIVVTYLDLSLKTKEQGTYTKRLASRYDGYSYEDFLEKLPSMGTLTLRGSIEMTPSKLYETYKERELIEDSNKAYKNVLDKASSHMQNDKSYFGWLFINHISLMLYYRVFNCIKEKGMVSKYSVRDVMEITKRITKQRLNDTWLLETGTNIQTQQLKKIFKKQMKDILAV